MTFTQVSEKPESLSRSSRSLQRQLINTNLIELLGTNYRLGLGAGDGILLLLQESTSMLSLPIRTFPIVRSAVGENAEKATALRSLKKSVRAQGLIAGNGEMD